MIATRAFSVVQFSPDPEELEFVNVAVALWDGVSHLHYLPDFPKLACVAPHFDPRLLRAYLKTLEAQVAEMPLDRLAADFAARSAQFRFLQPRALAGAADYAMLLRAYVEALSTVEHRPQARQLSLLDRTAQVEELAS